MEFTCATCGQIHDANNVSFGADAPAQWNLLKPDERAKSELTQEVCVIDIEDGPHFFVRACLEIPIIDQSKAFTWGVWVSLSKASLTEMGKHWEDPERINLGPYFGWLCTVIPEYPDTMYLKTMVHQREVGSRPLVKLEPTEHPLSVHQRDGISSEEMKTIIAKVLHTKS